MTDTNNTTNVASAGPLRAGLAWLGRALPTALVLAALAGLAWWGHRTGWATGSFTNLNGTEVKDRDDWCDEHGVPESLCVECNPDLLPRGQDYGWCEDHGVHNCPLEHPEVAQLPDSPLVTIADRERARRALDLLPRLANSNRCKLYNRRIQLASHDAAEKVGIEVEAVRRAALVESIAANGEVTYDPSRLARLSSRLPGSAWRVLKGVGDEVKRGEVLALVDAVEVGKAKAEFLQAAIQVDLKREFAANAKRAWDRAALPEADLRAAQAALREAEARFQTSAQGLVNLGLPIATDDVKGLGPDDLSRQLRLLGLPESIVRDLDPKLTTANLLPIVAPLDGVVVARDVVAGEAVDTTRVLFVVTDVRRMGLTLSLREEDAGRVKLGQPLRFRPTGADEEAASTVEWMSTAADEKTRTVKLRAHLPNDKGGLRANTFGQGRVILREEPEAVVVPSAAVHWEGDCFVVFVRDKNYTAEGAPKVFHVRTVRVGAKSADTTEIIAGVLPDEMVATSGSGALLAVLRKDNLAD